jgi:hypothetical protein
VSNISFIFILLLFERIERMGVACKSRRRFIFVIKQF